MIHKRPRHFEFARQFGGQRLDPKRFSGVVAGVEDVHAYFFRERERPVRPFPGDKRVHSFAGGLFQFAARAASDHADAVTDRRATRQQFW